MDDGAQMMMMHAKLFNHYQTNSKQNAIDQKSSCNWINRVKSMHRLPFAISLDDVQFNHIHCVCVSELWMMMTRDVREISRRHSFVNSMNCDWFKMICKVCICKLHLTWSGSFFFGKCDWVASRAKAVATSPPPAGHQFQMLRRRINTYSLIVKHFDRKQSTSIFVDIELNECVHSHTNKAQATITTGGEKKKSKQKHLMGDLIAWSADMHKQMIPTQTTHTHINEKATKTSWLIERWLKWAEQKTRHC